MLDHIPGQSGRACTWSSKIIVLLFLPQKKQCSPQPYLEEPQWPSRPTHSQPDNCQCLSTYSASSLGQRVKGHLEVSSESQRQDELEHIHEGKPAGTECRRAAIITSCAPKNLLANCMQILGIWLGLVKCNSSVFDWGSSFCSSC